MADTCPVPNIVPSEDTYRITPASSAIVQASELSRRMERIRYALTGGYEGNLDDPNVVEALRAIQSETFHAELLEGVAALVNHLRQV
jgi:hypothetical protein